MCYMNFSKNIINWYKTNKRDLPWRGSKNPYIIWLSEIILQQTRVNQGTPYFLKFIEKFKTIQDFANVNEEEILKTWEGLGYYSRARNMHFTAKYITNELSGNFPTNYKDLLKLKGIGTYTAAAIASICYEEKVAVADGNVFRVLSRYFGIDIDISLEKNKKHFQNIAQNLIGNYKPSEFNQALMEFGALQCKPKNPLCLNCVLNNNCVAFSLNKVDNFPVNLKKTKVKERYFYYFIIKDLNGKYFINKRKDKDIWQNLNEFYLIETAKNVSDKNIIIKFSSEFAHNSFIKNINVLHTKKITHKLTHQKLNISFFEVNLTKTFNEYISDFEIKNFAFPIVIQKFISKNYQLF